MVARAAQRRNAHLWARDFAQVSADLDDGECAQWLRGKIQELADLAEQGALGDLPVPISEVATEAFRTMVFEANGGARSISTGFPDLDRMIPFRGGRMIGLAGRPKMGKTTAALAITRAACLHRLEGNTWGKLASPAHVLWACSEMSNRELYQRHLADVAHLEGRRIVSPTNRWMERQLPAMAKAKAILDECPISYVPDKHCSDLAKVIGYARRWRARMPEDSGGERPQAMVVIDYLQRMTMDIRPRPNSREEYVAAMVRACKSLARELDCVVLVLLQLNRALERRDDKRPRASDCRESGAIEQEADAIIGAYRPIVYHEDARNLQARLSDMRPRTVLEIEERDKLRALVQAAELNVLANRHGPSGTCHTIFQGEYFRFLPRPGEDEWTRN
jgi:replicative DNA helicase